MSSSALSRQSGITLVELLVTVGIIAALSALASASLHRIVFYIRLKTDIAVIWSAVKTARAAQDDVLGHITGTWCGACACWDNQATPACVDAATRQFAKLGLPLMRNPWGYPYSIDENEGEDPSNSCAPDDLYFCKAPAGTPSCNYNIHLPPGFCASNAPAPDPSSIARSLVF
jgi:type II secretory pathway pseudopilin PulG